MAIFSCVSLMSLTSSLPQCRAATMMSGDRARAATMASVMPSVSMRE